MSLELQLLELDLSIAKLSKMVNIEESALKSSFFSLTKTDEELSLVVETKFLPEHQYANDGWRAFEVCGPMDFSLVGILNQITQPLAENNISIFSISTFNTDYILVKGEQVQRASEILSEQFTIK